MKRYLDTFSLVPWSHLGGFLDSNPEFDKIFDISPVKWSGLFGRQAIQFTPSCDTVESDTHYLFSFDVPGMPKEDIKVEITENTLVVSGERKETSRVKGKSGGYTERYYGKFSRSFTLPSAVNADRTEAEYKDGVLRISVPKVESAKPKEIKIGE